MTFPARSSTSSRVVCLLPSLPHLDWALTLARGAAVPPPDNQQPPTSPAGEIPQPFSYAFSEVTPTQYTGGTAKIADSTTFKVATKIAVAEVTVEPGAMREMHVSSGWIGSDQEWWTDVHSTVAPDTKRMGLLPVSQHELSIGG